MWKNVKEIFGTVKDIGSITKKAIYKKRIMYLLLLLALCLYYLYQIFDKEDKIALMIFLAEGASIFGALLEAEILTSYYKIMKSVSVENKFKISFKRILILFIALLPFFLIYFIYITCYTIIEHGENPSYYSIFTTMKDKSIYLWVLLAVALLPVTYSYFENAQEKSKEEAKEKKYLEIINEKNEFIRKMNDQNNSSRSDWH